jgi:exosome complex RNA-binding protein Rrp42 (RNase PH superfamily)
MTIQSYFSVPVFRTHNMLQLLNAHETSSHEKKFISLGVEQGIREDGRDIHDLRQLVFENKVLPHANGSSRVRIGDTTDLLCCVKVQAVDDHLNDFVEVNIDISPACNLRVDEKRLTECSTIISQQLERLTFLARTFSI